MIVEVLEEEEPEEETSMETLRRDWDNSRRMALVRSD
jgi:hypothetical protein